MAKRATKYQNATPDPKKSKQDKSSAQHQVKTLKYIPKPQESNTHIETLRDYLHLQLHSPVHLETSALKACNNSIRKTTEDWCVGRPPYDQNKRTLKADATHNKTQGKRYGSNSTSGYRSKRKFFASGLEQKKR